MVLKLPEGLNNNRKKAGSNGQGDTREVPAPGSTKTRVVERGGRNIRSQLVKSNPFPRNTCGRWSCPLKWKKEDCQDKYSREQIGYFGHCQLCRDA